MKCTTCSATYAPLLADNTRYFHQCPSLSDTEVIAALGLNADPSKWTALERQQFFAASRVRPNTRNENAPDLVTQVAIAKAAAAPDDAKHWQKVNAALETAIVSAGAGTQ